MSKHYAQMRLGTAQRKLADIFEQAGPEFDLSKVTAIKGTTAEKVAQIRELNGLLDPLKQAANGDPGGSGPPPFPGSGPRWSSKACPVSGWGEAFLKGLDASKTLTPSGSIMGPGADTRHRQPEPRPAHKSPPTHPRSSCWSARTRGARIKATTKPRRSPRKPTLTRWSS